MDNPDYVKPKDVAKAFGVTTKTVRAWADKGLLEAVVLPSGHRRFTAATVKALEESLQRKGTTHD